MYDYWRLISDLDEAKEANSKCWKNCVVITKLSILQI